MRPTTPASGSTTGIVLAGGRSTRFGRDKLREPYHGAPLLHHAVLALAQVCGDVLVTLAPGDVRPELPTGIPLLVQHDPVEGEGPLAALAAALPNVTSRTVLVAGGDMPGLAPPVLLELLHALVGSGADGAALRDGARFRPLPVALAVRRARPVASALVRQGERRLRTLLDALRIAAIDEETWRALDPEGRSLFDVDTPADLLR
jgi:molybdopterin-guanine dinucleotide biosynthesis protein A